MINKSNGTNSTLEDVYKNWSFGDLKLNDIIEEE